MKKAFLCFLLFAAFSSSFSQTFTLNDTQFKAGSYYRTFDLLFGLGNDTIRPECFSHLDSVVAFLNIHSSMQLEIGVHTDSRGSATANTDLSRKACGEYPRLFYFKRDSSG